MERTLFRLTQFNNPIWDTKNLPQSIGRYNPPELEIPVHYFSLHPLTPWAELLRFNYLNAAEVRQSFEDDMFTSNLWYGIYNCSNTEEITFDTASNFNLCPEDLISDSYRACHNFVYNFIHLKKEAVSITVPSAALPGTQNLVIFGELEKAPYEFSKTDTNSIYIQPAAVQATFPKGIVEHVRFKQAAHLGYKMWQNNLTYTLNSITLESP